jgi:uncharacterized membrane protein YbhN (UPF0104 family)
LPRIGLGRLFEGLLLTGIGWLFLGISLGAMLKGTTPNLETWNWDVWARIIGTMGVVYVAGFLVLVAPGGLGVREYLLMVFLLGTQGLLPTGQGLDRKAEAEMVAAGLRVAWTMAELVMVGLVWKLPQPAWPKQQEPEP